MKQYKKQILSYIMVFLLLLCPLACYCDNIQAATTQDVTATPEPTNNIGFPAITSTSCVIMDADTGQILYAKNPHERQYPASITKILTT